MPTIATAWRRSRGQALAEVALMLPFLVLALGSPVTVMGAAAMRTEY